MDVAALLVAGDGAEQVSQLSSFIASDVEAFANGKKIASGKAQWLRSVSESPRRFGEVLTYSHGWQTDGASLMVLDRIDTVDRSGLPPRAIADPRFATRATLYQFGTDHKIHEIQTLIGAGTWINPKR